MTLPSASPAEPASAFSLSRIPGTRAVLAGGIRYSDGNQKTDSVVFQYS